jgi:hypothetical protein
MPLVSSVHSVLIAATEKVVELRMRVPRAQRTTQSHLVGVSHAYAGGVTLDERAGGVLICHATGWVCFVGGLKLV